jgi:hypothetical protein
MQMNNSARRMRTYTHARTQRTRTHYLLRVQIHKEVNMAVSWDEYPLIEPLFSIGSPIDPIPGRVSRADYILTLKMEAGGAR